MSNYGNESRGASMYAELIRRSFTDRTPPYPVGQIEAAMRCARHDGCLDSITPARFVREVFQACKTLAELGTEDSIMLAWSYGLS